MEEETGTLLQGYQPPFKDCSWESGSWAPFSIIEFSVLGPIQCLLPTSSPLLGASSATASGHICPSFLPPPPPPFKTQRTTYTPSFPLGPSVLLSLSVNTVDYRKHFMGSFTNFLLHSVAPSLPSLLFWSWKLGCQSSALPCTTPRAKFFRCEWWCSMDSPCLSITDGSNVIQHLHVYILCIIPALRSAVNQGVQPFVFNCIAWGRIVLSHLEHYRGILIPF